ncbi:MAG: branched-chain amino acid ABC transporter permease [Oscillospiraceae bacterium]|nr:branched-chain amino acid ABC transporter permease [Oscillospiraceae bacterium]
MSQLYEKRKVPINLLALALMIAVPFIITWLHPTPSFILRIFIQILMFGTLAGALNVINGYSGQFCIGMAGFFAIGAYTHAILGTVHGLSFWINLPLAGIFTAMAGVLVSLPTLKMSGVYLALVTLGFSEIVRLVALNWTSLTNGAFGIGDIPRPQLFGFVIRTPQHFYYLFLGLLVVFLFVTGRVIKSRVGRAWMSIREDQLAAQSLAVGSSVYKSLNFAYGAFWAGVVGAAYAAFMNFIDSNFFTLDVGFDILSMVIIGGQGTLIGPLVGAAVVNLLTEVLRPFGPWRMVAYAALIIVMMWVRPQGLAGAKDSILAQRGAKLFARYRRRRAAAKASRGGAAS